MTDPVKNAALLAAMSPELKEKVRNTVVEQLDGALYCTRTWSAWSYGTMGEGDFMHLVDDDKYVDQLVNAVLTTLLE